MDDEYLASYSDLPLATQKLERWAEARDPLPSKIATTGANMTCSQMPGNLLPLHKLKGNHTFATQAATIGNEKAEEDLGKKPEREGETEPSADEDVEVPGRIGEMDQSIECIVCFVKAVKLYQKKNRNCFGCRSPEHLIWDCPEDSSRSAWKVYLNTKEEMAEKGGPAPQKSAAAQWMSPDDTPKAYEHLKRLPSWAQTHLLTDVDLKT